MSSDITGHVQGDETEYDFAVVDAQGAPEDITGWAFWFTLKWQKTDADPGVCQLTSDAGDIVIDIVDQGVGRICFASAHTKTQEPASYFYDFQCRKGPGGKLETLDRGTFTIEPEITRAA